MTKHANVVMPIHQVLFVSTTAGGHTTQRCAPAAQVPLNVKYAIVDQFRDRVGVCPSRTSTSRWLWLRSCYPYRSSMSFSNDVSAGDAVPSTRTSMGAATTFRYTKDNISSWLILRITCILKFSLNQRATGGMLGRIAARVRFLNIFACTGTRIVTAAVGGAVAKTSSDMVRTYLI